MARQGQGPSSLVHWASGWGGAALPARDRGGDLAPLLPRWPASPAGRPPRFHRIGGGKLPTFSLSRTPTPGLYTKAGRPSPTSRLSLGSNGNSAETHKRQVLPTPPLSLGLSSAQNRGRGGQRRPGEGSAGEPQGDPPEGQEPRKTVEWPRPPSEQGPGLGPPSPTSEAGSGHWHRRGPSPALQTCWRASGTPPACSGPGSCPRPRPPLKWGEG